MRTQLSFPLVKATVPLITKTIRKYTKGGKVKDNR